MPKYDPEKDIPDLSGRVILVTGGTAGLGAQTVTLLAAHSPSQIFFTGRSATSATTLITTLKTTHPTTAITFIPLDLASLASVQAGAKHIQSLTTRLDILICNAGVMALPPGLTEDGYEIQFGTNHVGHALLIKLLLPTMLATAKLPGADVRLVSLSSEGNQGHPLGGIIFKDLKTVQKFSILGPWQRYGQSKLANILYAAELARRYPDSGILFTSVHPGVFNTGLVTNLGVLNKAMVWAGTFGQVKDEKKEGQGAWNTCWAATAPREGMVNGEFYFPVGVVGRKVRENTNEVLAGRLWEWTQKELDAWN
ncbi:oxidoreductase [Cadophora sp. DSE1049]|nr:oxidoreductase [Cadophora sp. DSE1049]